MIQLTGHNVSKVGWFKAAFSQLHQFSDASEIGLLFGMGILVSFGSISMK